MIIEKHKTMKIKQYLATICLLACQLVFGQINNTSWPVKGATWVYESSSLGGRSYLKLAYIGDTIIENKPTSILKKTSIRIFGNPMDPDPANTVTYTNDAGQEYFYENQDSVFRWEDGAFELLYIFNAPVSSVWQIQEANNQRNPCDSAAIFDTLKVIENETYTISGHTLSGIRVESTKNRWSFFGRIVDKIGSMGSPVPIPLLPAQDSCVIIDYYTFFYTSLVCYHDKEQGYLSFSSFADCFELTTNIEQVHQSIIDLYPNPTNQELHISLPNIISLKNAQCSLWNIQGQKVFSTLVNSAKFTIMTSHLPLGIYTLQILSGGKLYSDKVLIVK